MRRRAVQPEIRSFVLLLWSPVTPFDRSKTKNANCFEERNVFGNGKRDLSALQEGRNWGANFRQGKVQNSSPIQSGNFWQGKVQNSSPNSAFWQGKVQNSSPSWAPLTWRHFRLSLSLSLSPSSPHAQYRKRGSASYTWYLSGIYCIIAFETAMRQQNFAKQNWTEKDSNKEINTKTDNKAEDH